VPTTEFAGPIRLHLIESRTVGAGRRYRWFVTIPSAYAWAPVTVEHGHANNFAIDYACSLLVSGSRTRRSRASERVAFAIAAAIYEEARAAFLGAAGGVRRFSRGDHPGGDRHAFIRRPLRGDARATAGG